MSGQLPMFEEATSPDTRSATSSPAADSGVSRCDGQDGPTADQRGQEVAPAPASRAQGKAAGLMTLVTSGLIGRDSSASASLQSSLENKLMTRLDTDGQTLFRQTWKRRRTPLGRSYLEHTASGRRTSGSGCTSWPTPDTGMNLTDANWQERQSRQAEKWGNNGFGPNLAQAATLASWPTPTGQDHKSDGPKSEARMNSGQALDSDQRLRNHALLASWNTPRAREGSNGGPNQANGALSADAALAAWTTPSRTDGERGGEITPSMSGSSTTQQASLCGWASPSARDFKDSPGMAETGTNPDGSERTRLDQLPRQANLASWPTPDMHSGSGGRMSANPGASTRTSGAKQQLTINDAATLSHWPTPMAGTPAQNGNNAAGNSDYSRKTEELARSVDFGLMPTGFHAAIQRYPEALSGGQLNPEHSLWLMAIPIEWASFVSRAMQSLSARRRRGSKRTSKREG